MKKTDNVYDFNRSQETKEGTPSLLRRVLGRTGRMTKVVLIGVLVMVVMVLIGVLVINQAGDLIAARQWLDEMNVLLMIWRTGLYCAAIGFAPRYLLTPDQQLETDTVKKARIITAIVAVSIEVLLVQKGLVGIAQWLQGGF